MEEDLKGPGIDTDVENFGTGDAVKDGGIGDANNCAKITGSKLIQSLDAKKEGDKNVTPFFAGNVQEGQPNRNDWKNKMMEILMDPKVPYEEKERIRRLLDGF